MNRKVLGIMILAVITLSLVLLFFACSGTEIAAYYEVKGGALNESSWIKIGGGKWEDDSGESGTYEIKGDTITFSQDGEEIMSATLKDGVLTLSIMGMPVGAYYTKDAFGKFAGKAKDPLSTSDPAPVGDDPGTGIISEEEDDSAKVKSITGGSVEGMSISYEVGENIEYVDLSGMLTVSKNSSWQLYEDITGQTLIPTKYAANLHGGNNVFYVVVNSSDDKVNRTYTLTIWKNYYVPVYYTVLGAPYAVEQALTHTYLSDYTAPSVEGYTFTGWGCAGVYVAGEPLTFAASLTANTYTVTLDANGGALASEGNTKTVTYDSSFTLPIPTRTGYTFGGWSVQDVLVTDESGQASEAWHFTNDTMVSADWTVNSYKVSVCVENGDAGTASGDGTYEYDSSVTLLATRNKGYSFLGWFDGTIKVSEDMNLGYTFNMPAESKTYTAKWELCVDHIPNEECICKKCGVIVHTINDNCTCTICGIATHTAAKNGYCRHGDYIYFGEYPQTIKADDIIITDTIDSRGYYLGSDGEYYAKVMSNPLNPYDYTFSTGGRVMYDVVYYFKVEPIKWRILEDADGQALILCDSIIDSRRFDDDSNNYTNSEIRVWLNDVFYNAAFSSLQRALVITTELDYITKDKLFLLSISDVCNDTYGFSPLYDGENDVIDINRQKPTSDYCRATGGGCWHLSEEWFGNGNWWLRSPYINGAASVECATEWGGGTLHKECYRTSVGVAPALRIALT